MARHKMTPEEKLLKVIEEPSLAVKAHRHPPPDTHQLSVRAITFVRQAWKNKEFFKFKNINKAMIGACVVITVVFIADFAYTKVRLDKRYDNLEASMGIADRKGAGGFGTLPFEEVLSSVASRNIFVPYQVKRAVVEDKPVQTLQGFVLVGVIWSSKPQAMVEDTEKKKTYLVATGDAIDDMRVKLITKNSITLERAGQEWELQ